MFAYSIVQVFSFSLSALVVTLAAELRKNLLSKRIFQEYFSFNGTAAGSTSPVSFLFCK
jgi:hypothetical protein